MRRGWVIGLACAVLLCVTLAVALAIVGSRFDQVRLEHEDLSAEVDDLEAENESLAKEHTALQTERDSLKSERDQLKSQADGQLKTIEQLKAELERARQAGVAAGSPGTSPGS